MCNTLATMFSGCNETLDAMVSVILSCPWIPSSWLFVDKSCSIADQNLSVFKSCKGRERLSFKYSAQKTLFVSVLSWKGDSRTEIGADGICCNNTLLQTTTPLVHYDEHMAADSNLPVRTLFTGEKSLIVHKHWTTVQQLTALIPFCLATFPQSLVLCLWLARLTPVPSYENAKLEPWHIIALAGKACSVHGRAYSDHLSGMLLFISSCDTCPVFLYHTRRHTHTQILLTEASGAAVLTENPGKAQCVACRN